MCTNTQKRLKHIDGDGDSRERKEYGANNPFRKKEKIENEKFFKQDFCFTCAYTRVRVKNTGKWVIFPDVDAVKRQEMPNLPLFSVFERVLYAKWTIYPPRSRNALYGLKNGFCAFLT